MKKTSAVAIAASLAVCVAYPAFAQSAAPLVVGQSAYSGNSLPAGTEIVMTTRTELTSRRTRVGTRFELEVAEPVMLNGQIVIPTGTIAVGEISRRRGTGMWGKRGILETRLLHIRMGDQLIRITGSAGDRGRAGTAGVIASAVFLPVAGFFVHGSHARIPAGTRTVGQLEMALPVTFEGTARPAGLVVPVSQQ
ncbi:MAG TPA: hypothetical protein VF603_14680 [Allosphingosinicella sp.]|jgi:hypothetical protein